MNTIYEKPGEAESTTNSNGNLNTTPNNKTTNSTNNTNNTNGPQNCDTKNGPLKSPNGSVSSTSIISDDYINDLKIIGHLKSIEQINEKRRLFLTNTICESNSAEKTVNGLTSQNTPNGTTTTTTTNKTTHTFNEEKRFHHIRTAEELLDSASDLDSISQTSSKQTSPLKTPATPPPKPPMLSRNRSINGSQDRATHKAPAPKSPPMSPVRAAMTSVQTNSTTTPVKAAVTAAPITAAVVTSTTIAEPKQAVTVQVEVEEPVVLRKSERPKSFSPDATKQISAQHYERLIEELKCPGCAYPMKGQVLLCKTGHSICAQCTRVLLLCPLCKEPFTNIRSLTVEALASKAHFRCSNAAGGCTVRLQIDLLGWHEKQCIYKPMKCFMGRVYGDCSWTGLEANWKEHLETDHNDKVFTDSSAKLTWDMGGKQKPLKGYYVFEVYDEMFNFYEIYDKERILFTMSCTSTVREKKHNFAFEVTMIHEDNEALAITQKFPVHSEYDSDILADGTCVSLTLAELAKFIDHDKLLHYEVRIIEVKSPRKSKALRHSISNPAGIPLDFQKTQIEGVNLKGVPAENIVTRKLNDVPYMDGSSPSPQSEAPISSEDDVERVRRRYNDKINGVTKNDSESESDPEFEAFIAKKWGTPQLHFNRKYLKNSSSDSSSTEDSSNLLKNKDVLGKMDKKFYNDADKVSMTSTSTSYKKKVSNTLRKSFRTLKTEMSEMKPFGKKSSPEKNVAKPKT